MERKIRRPLVAMWDRPNHSVPFHRSSQHSCSPPKSESSSGPYKYIWDERHVSDIDDVDQRETITHTQIRNGSKIYVEYNPESWSLEMKGKDQVFGCRLAMILTGLLESAHSICDFESVIKKRRMRY